MKEFAMLLPEIALLALALCVLAADWFLPKTKKRITGILAFWGIVAILAGIQIAVKTHLLPDAGQLFFQFPNGKSEFQGLVFDSLSLFLQQLFLCVTLIVILYSLFFFGEKSENQAGYYALLLFSTLGAFLLTGAMDLLVLFLSFELMSIPLYLLCGYQKRDARSNEAGLKYFLVGAVTSALLVYGISLIYAVMGTTDLREIAHTVTLTQILQSFPLLLGFFFILSVFAFKIALVPFHMWAPDVYEGAPAPVVSFLAILPKLAVIGFLLRFFLADLTTAHALWIWIFAILSALSMTVGNLTALFQTNLKRLLAYSGISQMGYLLVGFAGLLPVAASPPALQQGYQAVLFYLFAYAAADLTAFGVVTYLSAGGRETIDSCRGLGSKTPAAAFLLMVSLLSLAGLPPFLGFVGKFSLFASAFTRGFFQLVGLGILTSVISLFYYLRVAKAIYLEKGEGKSELPDLSWTMQIALWLPGLCVIVLGFFPQPILRFAQGALSKFLLGF